MTRRTFKDFYSKKKSSHEAFSWQEKLSEIFTQKKVFSWSLLITKKLSKIFTQKRGFSCLVLKGNDFGGTPFPIRQTFLENLLQSLTIVDGGSLDLSNNGLPISKLAAGYLANNNGTAHLSLVCFFRNDTEKRWNFGVSLVILSWVTEIIVRISLNRRVTSLDNSSKQRVCWLRSAISSGSIYPCLTFPNKKAFFKVDCLSCVFWFLHFSVQNNLLSNKIFHFPYFSIFFNIFHIFSHFSVFFHISPYFSIFFHIFSHFSVFFHISQLSKVEQGLI